MKIVPLQTFSPIIEIIELTGGLSGRSALVLRDWLFHHMDNSICKNYMIINLKRVTHIDGLGISVLEYFMRRGIDIRFLSVSPTVITLLKMAMKEDILKRISIETDYDKAVSTFTDEISNAAKTTENDVKARRYPRANTSFPANLKYSAGNDTSFSCNAKVLNLSESGLLASEVTDLELKKKEPVSKIDIGGNEYFDLNFELGGNAKHIKARGQYVWKTETNTELSVGIYFKDIREDYRKVIRSYVYNVCF